ncbi:MAG: glycosyltransferase [Eubacteriales bacterium]
MGGGLGLGQIESIVKILAHSDMDLQVITVTGKNEQLRTRLLSAVDNAKIKVLGYVENMAEVMAASDFIVTKPGGVTTAEVLTQKLPMIIINPLPGQELRNTEFLLNNGLAIKVNSVDFLIPQFKKLISSEKLLKQMKETAAVMGKPRAAESLVNYLGTIIKFEANNVIVA